MNSLSPSLFPAPLRQTIFVADLKCYLCGELSGTIESEQSPSGRRAVRLRRTPRAEPVPLRDWRELRCERCGGPLYLDEPDVIVRRTEEYDWLDERPRRGRPPKHLMEARRRERELLESQAA
jgi:hypothetical protein